jgi:hypothetical protein
MRSFRTRLSVESMEARLTPATLIELNTLASQATAGHPAIVVPSKIVGSPSDAGSVLAFDGRGVTGQNPVK